MYRIFSWPDIWPFFEPGSSQNSTRYLISQPDTDWFFLAVSSPIESAAESLIIKHHYSR